MRQRKEPASFEALKAEAFIRGESTLSVVCDRPFDEVALQLEGSIIDRRDAAPLLDMSTTPTPLPMHDHIPFVSLNDNSTARRRSAFPAAADNRPASDC